MIDIRAAARALGGDVIGRDAVAVPGPGHSARDRSLTVKFDPRAPDGFLVYSHCDDDWRDCRDHVRARLGLPPWQPGDGQDRRVPPSQVKEFDRAAINAEGGCAIGLTGKDGGLIMAKKLVQSPPGGGLRGAVDLGFVGEPQHVAGGVLDTLMRSDMIPVIAPIGVGASGETYNINADTVAGAVAAAVKATRLLLLKIGRAHV